MKVPLEITFRGVEKTDSITELIQKKAAALERVSDRITSCRVAVELPQQHQRTGRYYRVRVTLNVPSGHEFAVKREASGGEMHEELPMVIRDTFDAARRKLKRIMEKQRGDTKAHPAQDETAMVVRLFREGGYGFIRALDGREIYFHRNAVLHDDFDRITVGTGVRFEEEEGEEGPQASTVQMIDKPAPGGSASGVANMASHPGMGRIVL